MKMQKEKQQIGDKLLLYFGWIFIIVQLVWAMANLYVLITGNATNELSNLLNVVCGFIVYVLFQKSSNKIWLSKLYFLLTLFVLMYFAVVYVFIGSLKRPATGNDLIAFVIMAVGVYLIVYLYQKFFNRGNIVVQDKTDYAKMSDETLIREYNACKEQCKTLLDLQMNAADNGTFGTVNLRITDIIFTLTDKRRELKNEMYSRGLKCS